jgi:hypothetical protein
MAEIPYWDTEDGSWDRLYIDYILMPGVWKPTATCERDIDKKKSKGKDGARLTDHGYSPAEVRLEGRLVSREEWEELVQHLPMLHPRTSGGKRKPLPVEHPALALMGINHIYVKRIDAPSVESDGTLVVPIDCYEWVVTPKKKPDKTTSVTPPVTQTGAWDYQGRYVEASEIANRPRPTYLDKDGQVKDMPLDDDWAGMGSPGSTFAMAQIEFTRGGGGT